MFADIHPCDWAIVKPFVEILEDDFLIGEIVDEVGHLWDEFADVEGSDVVVGQ